MRKRWFIWLAAIITTGVASRMTHTGWVLIDKYLGDGLYAAMVYVFVRLSGIRGAAFVAMGIMGVIELFQLTLIPSHMLLSGHAIVRLAARLMGTQFSFFDLAAYACGIAGADALDRFST